MAHMVKRRMMVGLSARESNSLSTCAWTSEMALAKKDCANSGEPTGCPRTRKPVVTSTGGRSDQEVKKSKSKRTSKKFLFTEYLRRNSFI